MDQQLELKLDVKEAPAIPTDHPQWNISESESEKEDQHGNESEFTTDSSDEGDWTVCSSYGKTHFCVESVLFGRRGSGEKWT